MRLLSPATIERILEEQSNGLDPIVGYPLRYGVGFGLMSDATPLSPHDRSFYWGGWGGSMSLVDLESKMSYCYAMNRMASSADGPDMRAGLVLWAAHAALG